MSIAHLGIAGDIEDPPHLQIERAHWKLLPIHKFHPAPARQTQRHCCSDVPNLHIVVDGTSQNSDRDIGQVQRTAPKTTDLEILHQHRGVGREVFVIWAVESQQRLAVRRLAANADFPLSVNQWVTRSAVNERTPREIVNDSENGAAFLK